MAGGGGTLWFHEGANRAGSDAQSDIVLPASAPRFAATLEFHGGVTRIVPAPGVHLLINGKPPAGQALQPDTADHPDVVTLGKSQHDGDPARYANGLAATRSG